MKEDTVIKILGVCLIISVSCNVIAACIVIGRTTQPEKENIDVGVGTNVFNDVESTQNRPIPLRVDFDETMFYFIDNTEISSGFEIIFDYFSCGHEFHFCLNPDFYFLNISTNIEIVEKYFLNICMKTAATYHLLKNDEHHVDYYSTYPEKGFDGWHFCNELYLEIDDIDDFFVDKSFKIYWHESKSDMYVEQETFTFRFLNLEKIRLLQWGIPDEYIVSVNRNQLIKNWDDVLEEHTNGWHYLPGILKHDTDPWRDYPVEFWYNPNTYETVIKEVKI